MSDGLVDHVVICHLQCWEEDEGIDPGPSRTMRDIADRMQSAADLMGALPMGTVWEKVTFFVSWPPGWPTW
ncbi:hypothetical protein ACH444_33455 [Streptomyces microflavus]|uniref:hypothetical protein n=1 Tax=Streptomyces microflavus TaxID=1919 RepID=UPI00379012ED